jgi:hypothetical protein
LHAQPVRPASVMGPSSMGAEEGWSAPSSMDSTEEAPAKPAPRPKAAALSRAARNKDRRARLDITSSIAEPLKNP